MRGHTLQNHSDIGAQMYSVYSEQLFHTQPHTQSHIQSQIQTKQTRKITRDQAASNTSKKTNIKKHNEKGPVAQPGRALGF